MPANKLPKNEAKNQTPIIIEANFTGASFETSESPIGEIQSSAIVEIK